jgi:hypothetical protein
MVGVTGQQSMLTPPRQLILPSHMSGVQIPLESSLQWPFELYNLDTFYTLLTSIFCIITTQLILSNRQKLLELGIDNSVLNF